MKINIATFNIQHGINYPRYLATGEEVIDLKSCAEQIKDSGAVICALNEVYNEEKFGKRSQAEVIAKELSFNHVFAKAIDITNAEYGNALVTAFPIVSTETYTIELPVILRIAEKRYETRVLLHAVLDVDGTELSVYVCHFGLSEKEQKKAESTVTELIKKDERPAVFMGDFNITPDSPIIENFRSFLFDTSETAEGSKLTFPSDKPLKQIDYIFTNDKVKTLSAKVADTSCSDHRQYIATIEF